MVFLRTPGIYVKSIPFEGILTNRRIILVDRVKNLLPPTEIPLAAIREFEAGENAIRDQIIMLAVLTRTGETRQMILTFSRQTGGSRVKERDEWMRLLRENAAFDPDGIVWDEAPAPEPVQRRAEPAAGQRYGVVRSPVRTAAPPGEMRPQGAATDGRAPVQRTVVPQPVPPVPPAPPAARQTTGTPMYCPKCGTRVPAESVFCNRCGSPITRAPPVPAPRQAPPASIQAPPATPVPPAHGARPIDEEIRSIEPLFDRSTARVPPDPLRTLPREPPAVQALPRAAEQKPEHSFAGVQAPDGKYRPEDSAAGVPPAPFPGTAVSAPAPAYGDSGDVPLPPKRRRGRSFAPRKQTILYAAVALVVILIAAAGAFFIYPVLTGSGSDGSSGSGSGTSGSSSSPGTLQTSGTIAIRATQAVTVPQKGVFVHINYLGGFKGNYGDPDMLTDVPGNSGDRVWEVENVTNGTVQASFEKLDGSSHELLVEIYNDGKVLTSGTTTVGHGEVTLSVNLTTGIAAAPVTSGGGSAAKTTTAAPATSATVATTAPATTLTTVETTPPPAATTAAAANTTTAGS